MPYKSDQQRKFFHTMGALKAGIKPSTVKEFDKASKGMSLPEKVHPDKSPNSTMKPEQPPVPQNSDAYMPQNFKRLRSKLRSGY